jgi:hypothetical protein
MANTYTLISSVTVGSGGAATIEFTSIPATYTDLCLLTSTRNEASATSDINVTFNTSGGTYTGKRLLGVGSGSGESDSNSQQQLRNDISTYTANTFASGMFYVPNYASSNAKSTSADSVSENNATEAIQMLTAGLWSGTAAISTITLDIAAGQEFAQYSTAYLYGISNA